MKPLSEYTISAFLKALSSKEPVPGGGAASALMGAVGVALCSMVANLTLGKKKYAEYQTEIDGIMARTSASVSNLLELMEKDAEVFEPLSMAYKIPKDDLNREAIMEKALVAACSVPMEVLKEIANIVEVIERTALQGSRLAVSDAGVAALACRSAIEGAAMNVYINTKLMKNRDYAMRLNQEADTILQGSVGRCRAIHRQIADELRGM